MTLIDDKNAALIKAAVAGDVHTIKKLLDSGAEVNYQLDGVTPVLAAATAGHLDAVTLLLDRGADVNARDASSRTIIKLALDNDHVALAQALVKRYPNMIITDPRLPEGEAWLRKQFQLITENVKDSLSKPNPDVLERLIRWDLGPTENRNVSDTYWEHILLRYIGDIPLDIRRNYSTELKLSLVGTFDRILTGHEGITESARLLNSKLPTTQYDITETVIKQTGQSGGWVTERWGYHDNNFQVTDGIDTFLIENSNITVKMINYNVVKAGSRADYEKKIGLSK